MLGSPRNSAGDQGVPNLESRTNIDIFDDIIQKKPSKDIFLEKQNMESKEVTPLASVESTRSSRFHRVFKSIKNGDDIKTISIPGYHVTGNVVFYEVVVSNRKLRWNVWIRFDSFTILHLLMKDLAKGLEDERVKFTLPPMPEKHIKLLIDHSSREFVENRRALLENYLQKINQNKTLRHAEDFIHFLLPPLLTQDTSPTEIRESPHHRAYNNGDEKMSGIHSTSESVALEYSSYNRPISTIQTPKFLQREVSEMLFVSEIDEITGVEIKSATILEGDINTGPHAIYHIHVKNVNKDNDYNVWIVMKRFMDFVDFDEQLRESLVQTHPADVFRLPTLPPKLLKSLTNHLDLVFIEKRRVLLQVYLRRMIRYPLFRRHPLTLAFLGVKRASFSKDSLES